MAASDDTSDPDWTISWRSAGSTPVSAWSASKPPQILYMGCWSNRVREISCFNSRARLSFVLVFDFAPSYFAPKYLTSCASTSPTLCEYFFNRANSPPSRCLL